MVLLNEVVEQYGGIERLRKARSIRLVRNGRSLVLQYLEQGPTAEHAMRVVKCNCFGVADPEMHFEWRDTVWMPYYYSNGCTGAELFLYGYRSEHAPLYLNWEAGTRLIEMAFYLELNLCAEGFREAARDLFQPSLFASAGGAA